MAIEPLSYAPGYMDVCFPFPPKELFEIHKIKPKAIVNDIAYGTSQVGGAPGYNANTIELVPQYKNFTRILNGLFVRMYPLNYLSGQGKMVEWNITNGPCQFSQQAGVLFSGVAGKTLFPAGQQGVPQQNLGIGFAFSSLNSAINRLEYNIITNGADVANIVHYLEHTKVNLFEKLKQSDSLNFNYVIDQAVVTIEFRFEIATQLILCEDVN